MSPFYPRLFAKLYFFPKDVSRTHNFKIFEFLMELLTAGQMLNYLSVYTVFLITSKTTKKAYANIGVYKLL